MSHEPHLPRCDRCGKAMYTTWTEAHRAVMGLTRQRKAARGYRVYRTRGCAGFHIGRSTDHQRQKARRAA